LRVNLPGVASATKELATGEKVTYYYAWRGGPRLKGEPGTPEFVSSYEQAHRERVTPDGSVFKSIIADYLSSRAFTDLRDRTKSDYQKLIAKIENKFGDLPLAALEDPNVTKEFLSWRDKIPSARQADYAWTVLMLIIAWGRRVGLTSYRPPARIDRLYDADRSNKIWEDHHIAAFLAVAPEPLQWALIFAAEIGARQGDILGMPWSAYDGKRLRYTPSKTKTRKRPNGRLIAPPVSDRLQMVIESLPKVSPVMLTNSRGLPWRGNSFRKAWGAVQTKAALTGTVAFTDLRGTAVTRFFEAGCTDAEIATFTGHSLRDIHRILESYLGRTEKLGSMALAKLEGARR
jgi:integrase